MVDQVFADQTPNGNILWYLFDHQNTVRDVAVFDGTPGDQAEVVNHLTYNSVGSVVSADNPQTGTANDGDLPGLSGTGNEYSPQRSYTGREPDAVTGLIYYRARWYDPRLGRFISEDPLGFAAGDTNLSRHVGNSMPNAVDPTGLDFVDVDGEIAIWVEEDTLGRNGQSHDLGHVEGDTITLRPQYGGGQISLSRLKQFVDAGLRHNSLFMGVSTLTGLSDDDKQVSIRFAISEVYFRTNNATSLHLNVRAPEMSLRQISKFARRTPVPLRLRLVLNTDPLDPWPSSWMRLRPLWGIERISGSPPSFACLDC